MIASRNARAEAGEMAPFESWSGDRPSGWTSSPVSAADQELFRDNGFLVVENALSPEEVAAHCAEATAVCRGELGEVGGALSHEPNESDEDVLRQYLCIHFPHKISPLMTQSLSHPALVDALTAVIGPNVKCMQSMLFIKASGKPGQAWHQDEVYIPTRDRSLTGAWIALDDATVENGCLWVIPGSQKPGILWELGENDDRRFDCSGESQNFPWSNDDAVPVEMKAGSVVLFNGYLLHRSLPNRAASGFRRSLVNHYMSAESLLPWYGDSIPNGRHVAASDMRDIVMVAGEDPYAFRGTEDIMRPHVRPSGEGGCGRSADAE